RPDDRGAANPRRKHSHQLPQHLEPASPQHNFGARMESHLPGAQIVANAPELRQFLAARGAIIEVALEGKTIRGARLALKIRHQISLQTTIIQCVQFFLFVPHCVWPPTAIIVFASHLSPDNLSLPIISLQAIPCDDYTLQYYQNTGSDHRPHFLQTG